MTGTDIIVLNQQRFSTHESLIQVVQAQNYHTKLNSRMINLTHNDPNLPPHGPTALTPLWQNSGIKWQNIPPINSLGNGIHQPGSFIIT